MTREDIEKCFTYHAADAALEYYEQKYLQPRISNNRNVVDAFEAGAEWAQEFMIKKACEYLESALKPDLGYYGAAEFADTFRKAMEE